MLSRAAMFHGWHDALKPPASQVSSLHPHTTSSHTPVSLCSPQPLLSEPVHRRPSPIVSHRQHRSFSLISLLRCIRPRLLRRIPDVLT
jgi:hypothetical protein